MTDYRVYNLDSSGKTTGPPLIVYCEDDDAALIIAKRTMAGEGHTIEIWNGGRRVTTIRPTSTGNVRFQAWSGRGAG